MIDYAAARFNMVEGQLHTNKVTDSALLDAFLATPREHFVPIDLRGIAYVDEDVPLGDGRYLMEPMVLARLLQYAAVDPVDRALDIGCGTGYAAALLGRLASEVVAVETNPRLAAEARAKAGVPGQGRIAIVEAPLAEGCQAKAPYDVILIEGAIAAVPDAIAAQLAEGGRLVTVLRSETGLGQGVLMTRAEGVLSHRKIFDAATHWLPGFEGKPGFMF